MSVCCPRVRRPPADGGPRRDLWQVFAEGYYPREQAFSVSEERPTEISIVLERVPVRAAGGRGGLHSRPAGIDTGRASCRVVICVPGAQIDRAGAEAREGFCQSYVTGAVPFMATCCVL